jgi:hypothetical protein
MTGKEIARTAFELKKPPAAELVDLGNSERGHGE